MSLTKNERDMLVRIDERTERLDTSRADQETRIRALEKKWYTTLGAFVLAMIAFIKSMFA